MSAEATSSLLSTSSLGREDARAASRGHYARVREAGPRAIAPHASHEFLADLEALALETGASSELHERYAHAFEMRLAGDGKRLVLDDRHVAGLRSAQRHVNPKSFAAFEALRGYGLTNAAVLAGLIAMYREDPDGLPKMRRVEVKFGADTNELISAAAARPASASTNSSEGCCAAPPASNWRAAARQIINR